MQSWPWEAMSATVDRSRLRGESGDLSVGASRRDFSRLSLRLRDRMAVVGRRRSRFRESVERSASVRSVASARRMARAAATWFGFASWSRTWPRDRSPPKRCPAPQRVACRSSMRRGPAPLAAMASYHTLWDLGYLRLTAENYALTRGRPTRRRVDRRQLPGARRHRPRADERTGRPAPADADAARCGSAARRCW